MKTFSRFSLIFFLICLVTLPLAAQSEGDTVKRVRFARGRTTAVYKGSARVGQEVYYILGARRGQMMSVHLASADKHAGFQLYPIKGQMLADGANDWKGELPETNDYMIVVSTSSRLANFTLEITIR